MNWGQFKESCWFLTQEVTGLNKFSLQKFCYWIWQIWRKHLKRKDCIPVGCAPPARWPYLPECSAVVGGVCSGRCLLGGCLLRGGSALRGCLLRGVSALGGCIPACTKADTLPPREQNHIRLWKHNLAPTSVRAVKIQFVMWPNLRKYFFLLQRYTTINVYHKLAWKSMFD